MIAPTSAFGFPSAGRGGTFSNSRQGGYPSRCQDWTSCSTGLFSLRPGSGQPSPVCVQGNNPRPVLTGQPGAEPGTVGTGNPTSIISPEVLSLLTHSYHLTFVSKLWIYRGPRRSVHSGVSSQAAPMQWACAVNGRTLG